MVLALSDRRYERGGFKDIKKRYLGQSCFTCVVLLLALVRVVISVEYLVSMIYPRCAYPVNIFLENNIVLVIAQFSS